jgi:hypothetical protein
MSYFKVIKINDVQQKIVDECLSLEVSAIELNDKTSELVKKDLLDGKTVYYNTVDGSISVDLSKKELETFISIKKQEVYLKLKENLIKLNTGESLIDMIFYIDATMELFNAGYIITDKNREEKYIEIIETGDESLIELLEEYLNTKDEIQKIKWYKTQYNKNLKKLKELDENSEEFEKFIKII